MKRKFNIGYTEVEMEVTGIKDYGETSNGIGITIYYRDGGIAKLTGSKSAINVIKTICDTSIQNWKDGYNARQKDLEEMKDIRPMFFERCF